MNTSILAHPFQVSSALKVLLGVPGDGFGDIATAGSGGEQVFDNGVSAIQSSTKVLLRVVESDHFASNLLRCIMPFGITLFNKLFNIQKYFYQLLFTRNKTCQLRKYLNRIYRKTAKAKNLNLGKPPF
jgi:hypothetical protein